jgi:hypothetical protein
MSDSVQGAGIADPSLQTAEGRDHWPWVYSVAVAGGGTRPGTVLGASDGIAAYPIDHPRDPRDLAATVYHLLDVPPRHARLRPDPSAAFAGRRREDRRVAAVGPGSRTHFATHRTGC